MGSNSIWESHLQKEIGLTSVTVDAVLSEQFMRLADVQTFKVGQTLQLGRNADDCLELHCSGVRLARGQLGQRNSKVAIRIQSQIAGG
jgi:flagellar motor switch protein FliM